MHGGTIMDCRNRLSGILESEAAGPDLFQPGGSANLSSVDHQEDRVGARGAIENPNRRQPEGRFRQEGIAFAGTWRDVLHAVQTRVFKRSRWALASAPDVFRSTG